MRVTARRGQLRFRSKLISLPEVLNEGRQTTEEDSIPHIANEGRAAARGDSAVREESENPKVWARICINKLAELAKESTTMWRLLDPMLVYFDIGKHWPPRNGLALIVLSDMACFVKGSGASRGASAAASQGYDASRIPDVETRVGAHQIFSAVLIQTPNHPRQGSEYLYKLRKWNSKTSSAFASPIALLEKLR
ncbi:protein SEMI-ROLLED LEAF 2-like [Dioscorea cayenensis subsp. rotundata]|uniref:Protein SEMI-ROLLED LEAF 2-like n=1 Tax=Dioscorea cayennensis subsp. rotundata TaxID=55577 RepID=A0AB40CXL0_DIOCR|nr:protein SEMI-ROLLED LEAF 2-like [Dioscorea cayenensis subsp. rotundata]